MCVVCRWRLMWIVNAVVWFGYTKNEITSITKSNKQTAAATTAARRDGEWFEIKWKEKCFKENKFGDGAFDGSGRKEKNKNTKTNWKQNGGRKGVDAIIHLCTSGLFECNCLEEPGAVCQDGVCVPTVDDGDGDNRYKWLGWLMIVTKLLMTGTAQLV